MFVSSFWECTLILKVSEKIDRGYSKFIQSEQANFPLKATDNRLV